MKKQRARNSIIAEAAPLSGEDEGLLQYVQELQRDSLVAIENAARQIIQLVTTLLSVFFGVLALGGKSDLDINWNVKGIGVFALIGYFTALYFSLKVVIPRPIRIPENDLTEIRRILMDLVDRKNRSLKRSQILFGISTFLLLAIIIILLISL